MSVRDKGCACVCVHLCVHACIGVGVCACEAAWECRYLAASGRDFLQLSACVCVCIHVCALVRTSMHVFIFVFRSVCVREPAGFVRVGSKNN